jgi:hypothetical protein
MKTISLMAVVMVVSSAAQAANGIIPVREVRVTATEGCGVPPPGGGPCTQAREVSVSFTVESGNAECHQYGAQVLTDGENSVLTIREFGVRRVCTAPDQKNYRATVPVMDAQMIQGDLTIANPTYVETFFRP